MLKCHLFSCSLDFLTPDQKSFSRNKVFFTFTDALTLRPFQHHLLDKYNVECHLYQTTYFLE